MDGFGVVRLPWFVVLAWFCNQLVIIACISEILTEGSIPCKESFWCVGATYASSARGSSPQPPSQRRNRDNSPLVYSLHLSQGRSQLFCRRGSQCQAWKLRVSRDHCRDSEMLGRTHKCSSIESATFFRLLV